MHKEAVNVYREASLSIYIVWLPMVAGDGERAARDTGAMYPANRVHQFYDGNHTAGLAFMRDLFSGCVDEAIQATPKEHPVYQSLLEYAENSSEERPLWDAVLYYPKGVEWSERVPKPLLWSKQVGYWGDDGGGGEITGTFFKDDCSRPPVDSDWNLEVRTSLKNLLFFK